MKLNRVKKVREEMKLTQEQLAAKVDCSIEEINEIEESKERTGFIIACKISFALGVDLKDLFPLEYSRKEGNYRYG
ncbi:MAG TPA: helix-turn-helix domain-containing protein [Edaphocola sp.]|nr:helix-turn-helix domain-containing protein [Edaphocola sp.]